MIFFPIFHSNYIYDDSKNGDIGDVGDQVSSDLNNVSNDQVLIPIRLFTRAYTQKFKDQLNTFVRVVHESIEGSKMVENFNQEERSIVTLIQVVQQASH